MAPSVHPIYLSDLTDADWALLARFVPAAKPGGRPRSVSMRRIGNGLFYLLRTGSAWRYPLICTKGLQSADVFALGVLMHHLLTKQGPRLRSPYSFHTHPMRQYNPAVTPELVGVENWPLITILGDEIWARRAKDEKGARKARETRNEEYQQAVRAYRLLTVVLREQAMNEDADRFAYRAQLCSRRLPRLQRHYLRYLGSLFLGLISGYGYRPLRSIATYLLVVTVFGLAYWALGVQTGHTLTWNEAGVVSLTAFHGRGFFATAFQPGDPQAALAAIEAVVGLLIEITFIATFTQRFFAR
jgi:hypothetical protein